MNPLAIRFACFLMLYALFCAFHMGLDVKADEPQETFSVHYHGEYCGDDIGAKRITLKDIERIIE